MYKRNYTWFIEPLSILTNEVIAKELIYNDLISREKGRNLWECSYDFALRLMKSKVNSNLDFRIYGREGRYGKIRDCTFLFSSKWRKKLKRGKKKTAV